MSEETLGRLIKEERKKRQWTQGELAAKIGVSLMTVQRWEHDKTFPHFRDRSNLGELLGSRVEAYFVARNAGKIPSSRIDPFTQQTLPSSEEKPVFIEAAISEQKIYRGWRAMEWDEKHQVSVEKLHVTVNGQPLPYFNKYDPVYGNADPEEVTIYEWGYTAAGPRRLAESILGDYFGETAPQQWEDRMRSQTRKYSNNFKMDFVAWFPKDEWEISSKAIDAWLKEQKEGGDPAPEHTLSDVDSGWRGWSERWDEYKAR